MMNIFLGAAAFACVSLGCLILVAAVEEAYNWWKYRR